MIEYEKLVSDNLALVHSCARRFIGKGVEYDDLFQAGSMGLVKAAKGFDKQRGLQFSTYAVPAVLGEIKRLFRDGGTVKVSRSIKELQMKINKQTNYFRKKGIEPTVSQIAEALDVSVQDITEALCAAQPVISLTVEYDEKEEQLDIKDNYSEEQLCDKITIQQAVEKLEENDKAIIQLRYFSQRTQNETAKQLNMTQVQISRREKIILNQLRKIMTGQK